MSVVSSSLLNRPLFHLMCNDISGSQIQFLTLLDHSLKILVHFLRKSALHHCIIKYIFTKYFCYVYYITHILVSFPFFVQTGTLASYNIANFLFTQVLYTKSARHYVPAFL